jgi:molybdopterin-guanine dinucleotide biosynthesis protein
MGLPTPPGTPTTYVVYIASRQWRKVAEAIRDPEDVLIIEGFPQLDPQTSSIAVFATNTTTKKLQMAQRQAQAAKSDMSRTSL